MATTVKIKEIKTKLPDLVSNEPQLDKSNVYKQYKEREDFQQRLIEFHRHKSINTPLTSWPTLNGKSIDLFKLYTKVASLGGWETVCEKDKWNDVGTFLDKQLLASCTNGSHALRLIYIRYLSSFEKFNQSLITNNNSNCTALLSDQLMFNLALNTFNPNQQLNNPLNPILSSNSNKLDDKSDELSLLSKRKFSYLVDSTSMNYHYNQHHSNLSSETRLGYNPYEKLEISLISGLANEIDFVFNTILLLSSDEYHKFRIYSSPRLLHLLLAHIGFFGQEESNYRYLYDNVWNSDELRRNFVKFWHSTIKPLQSSVLEDDDEFGSPNPNQLINNLLPKLYNSYLKTLPEKELLNLETSSQNESKMINNSNSTVELRRIEQVMVILNNLSFEDNNADFMANKSPVLIEFLIMCIYCTNCTIELKKHSLDILSNISRKMKLNQMSTKLQRLLLITLSYLIVGNTNNDNQNDLKEHYDEQNQDRLDIIRGLEILTKLTSQQVDPQLGSVDYLNEDFLSQYYLNESTGALFLNKILVRLEQLLSVQDVFILLNSLECLYHMSQFNEVICNLSVSYTSGAESTPKIVQMLVNFLTVDMTHFGLFNTDTSNSMKKTSQNMKIYKICSPNAPINQSNISNTINITPNGQQAIVINQANSSNSNNNKVNNQNSTNLTSLLHQTLNNQHNLNSNTNTTSNNTVSALLNTNSQNNKVIISASSPNLQQQQVNQIMNSTNNTTQRTVPNNQEQQAKNVLCNWLRTCFQLDSNSEISKTKLYPYYQQIAKINNWTVLTIPTFFEILNATFPNLRYNEATNQIQGIRLFVNVKQQLILKKDELIQQADSDTSLWPQLSQNNNNVKVKSIGNTSIITTNKTNGHSNEIVPNNKIPQQVTNINVITPTILPLLTPPTPPSLTDENLNNNSQANGTLNSLKLTSKLLNDTSNVKIETSEQQSIIISDSNKKYEKKNEKIKSEDPIINNIERKIEQNNENNIKINGIINDHKLQNGNSKHGVTNGNANHSCSSSTSSDSEEDDDDKMDDDGQIESFRKRKNDNDLDKTVEQTEKENDAFNESPIKKQKSEVKLVKPELNGVSTLKINGDSIPATTPPPQANTPTPITVPSGEFVCEWNNCKMTFNSAKSIYSHVCKYHLLNTENVLNCQNSNGGLCLWLGCDQIKRQKWALVNHVQERHCNETALKTAVVYRQRGLVQVTSTINASTSVNLNYSNNAALLAIQKNQRKTIEEFVSIEEGPVSKSIRLLSALTLRNLARNSNQAKEIIKKHESVLTEIAFDLLESSTVLANCLWHLTN